jgi:hypothetical protein
MRKRRASMAWKPRVKPISLCPMRSRASLRWIEATQTSLMIGVPSLHPRPSRDKKS